MSPPRHQNDHDSNREPQQPRQQPQKKKKSSDDEDDDDDDEDGFAAGGVQYDAPLPKRSIVAVEEEMLPRKGTMEAATSSNHEGGGPDRVDSRDRRVSIDRVGVTRSDRGRERSRDRYRVDRASRDGYTDRVDSRGGRRSGDRYRVDSRDRRFSIDPVDVTRSDRGPNRRKDHDRAFWASRVGCKDRVNSIRGGSGRDGERVDSRDRRVSIDRVGTAEPDIPDMLRVGPRGVPQPGLPDLRDYESYLSDSV